MLIIRSFVVLADGRRLQALLLAVQVSRSHGHVVTSRFRYKPEQIRSLKNQCCGLPRETKRFIFYLGIRNAQHKCSSPRKIDVRISKHPPPPPLLSAARPRHRCLKRLECVGRPRTRRPSRAPCAQPSIMLSNVRSISNKVDEIVQKLAAIDAALSHYLRNLGSMNQFLILQCPLMVTPFVARTGIAMEVV